MKLTRRTFLKKTGLTAAAFPLLSERPTRFTTYSQLRHKKTYEVPSVCGMCPARCPIIGKVRNGRLVKLEGNPKSPYTGSKICARGQAAIKLVYDPDRLRYPLKRAGERGEGKWSRISWGEAIDTIAFQIEKAIKRNGPDSLALFVNGPSSVYIRELFEELSVPYINNSSSEYSLAIRDLAYQLTFGMTAGRPERVDLKHTECILLMGTHLGENVQLPQLRDAIDAIGRGAKLIVVDPRFSSIAAKAGHYLAIRPGTDTALLLGWCNHIITNGLYDREYVSKYVEGFAEFKEHVRNYSLERVAALTDIPPDQIRDAAELMAIHAPAVVVHPGGQAGWYGNDVQRLRAKAVLAGLLGSWGVKGGMFLPSRLPGADGSAKARKNNTLFPEYPDANGTALLNKTLKGDIKLLGCWGQNPFHGHPNPYRTVAAFKKAEFVFACDVLPSEPSLYADIVLPEASFLERSDVVETWPDCDPPSIAIRYPVVEPRFEAKDPYWIVKQLSARIGKGKGFRHSGVMERLEERLSDFGFSVDKLYIMGGVATFPATPYFDRQDRKNGSLPEEPSVGTSYPFGSESASPKSGFSEKSDTDTYGDEVSSTENIFEKASESDLPEMSFPTPSGKIEFFSTTLQEKGFSPMPDFEPAELPPPGFARLLYGRSPVHTQSSTCNNSWLVREVPENEVWVNEKVAVFMGLDDGEELFLENLDGIRSSKAVRIKVTPGIRPDCVYMVHGFGSRSHRLRIAFHRGVSDTSLILRSAPDPVSGLKGLRTNFVRFVRKGKPLAIPMMDDPPSELKTASIIFRPGRI